MLTWLFAPRCASCGGLGAVMCEICATTLVELGAACERCAEPSERTPCRRCAIAPLPLDRVVSAWRYGGGLATAIRRLKLGGRTHVARDLAPLWAPLLSAVVTAHDALVVPVPTHWRRRLARGFDHGWLLALHGCRAVNLPRPRALLRRVRATPVQRGLSAAARRSNLIGAFAARDRASLAGRTVVLVDDVATTGATLAAAAGALRDAGATCVIGVVLARAAAEAGTDVDDGRDRARNDPARSRRDGPRR